SGLGRRPAVHALLGPAPTIHRPLTLHALRRVRCYGSSHLGRAAMDEARGNRQERAEARARSRVRRGRSSSMVAPNPSVLQAGDHVELVTVPTGCHNLRVGLQGVVLLGPDDAPWGMVTVQFGPTSTRPWQIRPGQLRHLDSADTTATE